MSGRRQGRAARRPRARRTPRQRAVLGILVSLALLVVLPTPCALAAPAPVTLLPGAADVPGMTARTPGARAAGAWKRLLGAKALRAARPSIAQRAFVAPSGGSAVVVRVLVPKGKGRTSALAAALRRAGAARGADAADAAALGLSAGALRGATRAVWAQSGAVGQVVVLASLRTAAQRASALLVALERAAARRGPATAWDRVVARIGASGRPDRATALQAFSLAVAKLPGVRVPPGSRAGASAQLAMDWIVPYIPKLTAAQFTVVQRNQAALFGIVTRRSRGARASGGFPQNWTPDPNLQVVAEEMASEYANPSRLGFRLFDMPEVVMTAGTTPEVRGTTQAITVSVDAQDQQVGPSERCRIALLPKGQALDTENLRLVMAHEVFHCFSAKFAKKLATHYTNPPWLTEGLANWASCEIAPTKSLPNDYQQDFDKWFKDPKKSLFVRDYDSIGFWEGLTARGGELWSRLPTMWQDITNDAKYATALAGQAPLIENTWASSLARDDDRGAPWEMKGPCVPPTPAGPRVPLLVGAGQTAKVSVFAHTARLWELAPSAELFTVSSTGHARLSSKDGFVDRVDPEDQTFCAAGDCKCPSGTTYQGPPFKAGSAFLLALTGGADGSSATVKGRALGPLCKKGKKPSGGGGGGGDGASNGDPHIYPFDGSRYDFQAAGEFVLARSGRDFEVQARQEPLSPSKRVTVNTAVALRVGSARVTFATSNGPPAARLNGKVVLSDADPVALPGGGTLRRLSDGWAVHWADGSRVLVSPISIFGLLVAVQPADSRRGKLEGLLGDFNGSTADDVQTADGKTVKPTDFKTLYGTFRESWKVTKKSSLFDYAPGQGTEDFDKPDIPDRPVTIDDLPAKKRRAAERVCRLLGVDQQPILDDCILDVALSGKNDFASAAARLLAILESGGEADSAPWEQISGAVPSFAVTPSAGLAGGRPLLTWGDRDAGAVRSETFDTSVTDAVANPDTRDIVTGWLATGDEAPQWTPAGGGNAVLFTGSPPSPINLGGWVSTRGPDGSWSDPVKAMPSDFDDIAVVGDAPIGVQGRPGGSGLSATAGIDPSGSTRTEVYDRSKVAVDPALARDGTGATWLAYRTIVSGPADDGLYMRPLDGVTGAPIGVSVRAPGSEEASSRTGGAAPLVCSPAAGGGCRVVYASTGAVGAKRVLSWAPGEAAPTVVAAAVDPRAVAAAYRSDGRLWVTWLENDGTLRIVLGDARGAGAPAALGYTTQDPDVSRIVLQPVGDDVVLVANIEGAPNLRYLFATHVAAPAP
jgi:hypothetical protein